jgi:Universal stress protein family
LAAIDGLEQSMHAADFAISIAIKYEAELIALYVFYSQIGYAYTSYLSKVEDSPSMAAILYSSEVIRNSRCPVLAGYSYWYLQLSFDKIIMKDLQTQL